jgi:glucoamylase
MDAHWASANKEGVGTSASLKSKVWFTLGNGIMTEVFYPRVDIANVQALQFVLVGPDGRVLVESENMEHRTEVSDARALSYTQINSTLDGRFAITKTYSVDPNRNSILISVKVTSRGGQMPAVYVYFDPSINNSGMRDSARTQSDAMVAWEKDKASALLADCGFSETTNGFLGVSDGLTQLKHGGHLGQLYANATDGNVVQVAKVKAPSAFTIALSFGPDTETAISSARASLRDGFNRVNAQYLQEWHIYLNSLKKVDSGFQREFETCAMVLKAHEDKTYLGATVASLTVPWGGGSNANDEKVSGYHAVWARDLYQVATALVAAGDTDGANRALDYLFNVQQRPDGSLPQNTWIDGRAAGSGLQLDEVAFPLVLAYQLGRVDGNTWSTHIKPAAEFLLSKGPSTPQERWEEESGFSPSTLAAEIAGLVCASEIAKQNGDLSSAQIYLAAADDWARNVDAWTATTTGRLSEGPYYIRIAQNGNPDNGDKLEINSNGGIFDERAIVDAGFLELVRLGIKPADDPLVVSSLRVVDRVIREKTPYGDAWYRYNHDAYGERPDGGDYDAQSGRGRLWTLLTGERGQYDLARGNLQQATSRLKTLSGFINTSGMLSEQVWDQRKSPKRWLSFGRGTGSATPLCWSAAQFMRLAASIQAGRNLDVPPPVASRYAGGQIPGTASFSVSIYPDSSLTSGVIKAKVRTSPGSRLFVSNGNASREIEIGSGGATDVELSRSSTTNATFLGVLSPSGATAFQRFNPEDLPVAPIANRNDSLPPTLIRQLSSSAQSPLIVGNDAYFIYRGAARTVEVVGDFTGWASKMFRLSDLDEKGLRVYKATFDSAARVEYKYIADGVWITDPLNKNSIDNGGGSLNSFFSMPAYRGASHPGSSAGFELATHSLNSAKLGSNRAIQVYLPPGYRQGDRRYKVLYLQDGSEYRLRAKAAATLDAMIRRGEVEPFIIIFIDPRDRLKEYWANDDFSSFMATELVPFVDSHYRTVPDRSGRALMGASLGGVISVWTAIKYPAVFAHIAGQSSAFQIDDEKVVGALSRLNPAKHQFTFYFDVGRMEPILGVNRRTHVMLAAKGFPIVYREAEAGHNWTSWSDRLRGAYLAVWGDNSGTN